MAHRAIPMIAFPRVWTIYIYMCIYLNAYVTYVSMSCIIVKEVATSRGLDQLMGIACKRTHTWATDQQESMKN